MPASGKTTWALKRVNANIARVNKDDIRAMTQNSKFSKKHEKLVLKIRDDIIREYLSDGISVIVDDTNYNPIHEKKIREIAHEYSADFEVKEFDTSLEECIRRDSLREKSVGRDVILRIDLQRRMNSSPLPIEEKKNAIIVDIDGTIAKMNNRSPYDWGRVGEDAPHQDIIDLVKLLSKDHEVIIVSGRDGSCWESTKNWLIDNKVPFSYIYMRLPNDRRKDSIIKKEIYDSFVKPLYQVKYVLDDRNQVVEMWRDLGLRVLQVAEGDF